MGRLRKSVWHRAAVLVLIAFNLTVFSGVARSQGIFQAFRERTADSLFPRGERDPRVVVVGIDSRSILGKPFPFPRGVWADVVNKLFDAGASVVSFDVQFDAPGPGDDAFAAAMRRGKVVLVATGELDQPRRPNGARVVREGSLGLPNPTLAAAATAIGHGNVLPDPDDGVVRVLPLVAETVEVDVPSLALATYKVAKGVPPDTPMTQRPFGVQIGDEVVPTERQQTFRISWTEDLSSPDSPVAMVSVADIIDGKTPPVVKGAIVMIGATVPILSDFRLTPPAKANLGLPGVHIHANALNTMLTESYLRTASQREQLAWIFVLALLIATLSLAASWRISIPVVLVVGAAFYFWVNARMAAGVILDVVYPAIAMLFALITGLGLRYVTEGRQRRRVAALFSQYVPPEVARKLVEDDRVEAAAEGERVEITVLFCDLRGFTAISAGIEPHQVREMLELYYLHLSQLILDHGGTLMQYVGDEIFAIFGAPVPFPDHRQKAIDCAIAMQNMRPQLGEMLAKQDLAPVFYGIGLNAGHVVAAHIGSAKLRRQYSVIGDIVNIGARLCSQAREDQICFTEQFREQVRAPEDLDDLGLIEFKNATRPLQVWRWWAPFSRPERPKAAARSRA